jgi:membrane protease YdiL (CAAX protease family)
MADDEAAAPARSRRRAFLEIATVYGLILLVIWTPRPWQRWLWWVAAAAVVIITSISWDGLEAMGLRRRNFLRSLWIVGAALCVALVAAGIAAHFGTLRVRGGVGWLLESFWLYAVWAGVQQFLLLCFFLLRMLRLIPNRRVAAYATAGIFAAAHLPNPILVTATIVWGVVACLLFLRYRNLYPLALAHAILGIMIAVTIPGTVDHNMRVGLGYLRYNPHKVYRHTH